MRSERSSLALIEQTIRKRIDEKDRATLYHSAATLFESYVESEMATGVNKSDVYKSLWEATVGKAIELMPKRSTLQLFFISEKDLDQVIFVLENLQKMQEWFPEEIREQYAAKVENCYVGVLSNFAQAFESSESTLSLIEIIIARSQLQENEEIQKIYGNFCNRIIAREGEPGFLRLIQRQKKIYEKNKPLNTKNVSISDSRTFVDILFKKFSKDLALEKRSKLYFEQVPVELQSEKTKLDFVRDHIKVALGNRQLDLEVKSFIRKIEKAKSCNEFYLHLFDVINSVQSRLMHKGKYDEEIMNILVNFIRTMPGDEFKEEKQVVQQITSNKKISSKHASILEKQFLPLMQLRVKGGEVGNIEREIPAADLNGSVFASYNNQQKLFSEWSKMIKFILKNMNDSDFVALSFMDLSDTAINSFNESISKAAKDNDYVELYYALVRISKRTYDIGLRSIFEEITKEMRIYNSISQANVEEISRLFNIRNEYATLVKNYKRLHNQIAMVYNQFKIIKSKASAAFKVNEFDARFKQIESKNDINIKLREMQTLIQDLESLSNSDPELKLTRKEQELHGGLPNQPVARALTYFNLVPSSYRIAEATFAHTKSYFSNIVKDKQHTYISEEDLKMLNAIDRTKNVDEIYLAIYEYFASPRFEITKNFKNEIPQRLLLMLIDLPESETGIVKNDLPSDKSNLASLRLIALQGLQHKLGNVTHEVNYGQGVIALTLEQENNLFAKWKGLALIISNSLPMFNLNKGGVFGWGVKPIKAHQQAIENAQNYNQLLSVLSDIRNIHSKDAVLNAILDGCLSKMFAMQTPGEETFKPLLELNEKRAAEALAKEKQDPLYVYRNFDVKIKALTEKLAALKKEFDEFGEGEDFLFWGYDSTSEDIEGLDNGLSLKATKVKREIDNFSRLIAELKSQKKQLEQGTIKSSELTDRMEYAECKMAILQDDSGLKALRCAKEELKEQRTTPLKAIAENINTAKEYLQRIEELKQKGYLDTPSQEALVAISRWLEKIVFENHGIAYDKVHGRLVKMKDNLNTVERNQDVAKEITENKIQLIQAAIGDIKERKDVSLDEEGYIIEIIAEINNILKNKLHAIEFLDDTISYFGNRETYKLLKSIHAPTDEVTYEVKASTSPYTLFSPTTKPMTQQSANDSKSIVSMAMLG